MSFQAPVHSQTATTVKDGPASTREPGTSSPSPTWVAAAQARGLCFTALPRQGTGSHLGSRAARTPAHMWCWRQHFLPPSHDICYNRVCDGRFKLLARLVFINGIHFFFSVSDLLASFFIVLWLFFVASVMSQFWFLLHESSLFVLNLAKDLVDLSKNTDSFDCPYFFFLNPFLLWSGCFCV